MIEYDSVFRGGGQPLCVVDAFSETAARRLQPYLPASSAREEGDPAPFALSLAAARSGRRLFPCTPLGTGRWLSSRMVGMMSMFSTVSSMTAPSGTWPGL